MEREIGDFPDKLICYHKWSKRKAFVFTVYRLKQAANLRLDARLPVLRR